MIRVIARRLGLMVFVIWGVTLITFLLSHVIPGDPARLMAGPKASPQAIENIKREFGLTRPLVNQYTTYVGDLLHGNLGTSFLTRRSVGSDLSSFFPATLELALFALIIGTVGGLSVALAITWWRHTGADAGLRLGSAVSLAMPAFWAALLLKLAVGIKLGWLPLTGRLNPGATPPPHVTGLYTIDALMAGQFQTFWSALSHLILPGFTLSLGVFGLMARIMRSSLLDVREEDYVRTADAKGLRPWRILRRHVLRNAMLPGITVVGLQFGALASGIFVVEYIFAWPGVGEYAFNAFQATDYNAIMGVTIVVAILYVLANFVVDMIYLYLDPRIRYA